MVSKKFLVDYIYHIITCLLVLCFFYVKSRLKGSTRPVVLPIESSVNVILCCFVASYRAGQGGRGQIAQEQETGVTCRPRPNTSTHDQ